MDKSDYLFEESDEAWQSYFYPGTNVLINKKNLMDIHELDACEEEITDRKLKELQDNPIYGSFDKEHLCAIHRYLFDELYDWAGIYRIVYMRKEDKNSFFATAREIAQRLEEELNFMKEEFRKKVFNRETFVDFITDFYITLLDIHPFREGNGRAIREFLREFTLNKSINLGSDGFALDWSRANHNLINEHMPMARFFNGPIKMEIDKVVVPFDYDKKRTL